MSGVAVEFRNGVSQTARSYVKNIKPYRTYSTPQEMGSQGVCDSWSVDENLRMLYAVFKVMSVEQRNILTVSSEL